jgi:AraC-like DNA-binding protein
MKLSVYDIECIQRAKDFIDSDVTRHRSIQEIAAYSGMSATRLKEGFKLSFGKGLFHYLKDQRLEKGKYLVENTDKTLREISRGLGYKHECNFITAFKKEFGKSPGIWRNKIISGMMHFYWINFFDIDGVPELLLQAGNFFG